MNEVISTTRLTKVYGSMVAVGYPDEVATLLVKAGCPPNWWRHVDQN